MRKYLLVLAALLLTGCAYGQYKTSYMQKYSGYDCRDLKTELNLVEAKIERLWKRKVPWDSRHGPPRTSFYFAPPGWPWDIGRITPLPVEELPSGSSAKRIRYHARREAILELLSGQGCAGSDTCETGIGVMETLFLLGLSECLRCSFP